MDWNQKSIKMEIVRSCETKNKCDIIKNAEHIALLSEAISLASKMTRNQFDKIIEAIK